MVVNGFNITKNFGRTKALDNVSFSIKKGTLSLLVGPNGAGKTTLMRILAKELLPSKGEIKYEDKAEPSFISFSDENREVFENFTPLTYCRLWQNLYPGFDKEMFLKMIEERKIIPNKEAFHLSKGRKTWLFNTLAIASGSQVMLLDEPLQHLDPLVRERFREILLNEREKGRALLVSSHEISEFENITDRLIILCEGNILYEGDKEKACMTHRVIPGTSCEDGCRIIGPIVNEKLVLTEKNTGRKPSLKDITVGYLNGHSVSRSTNN
jgi:ABC-2 type transport system ATP-binding protein